jgi:hypothetical protein
MCKWGWDLKSFRIISPKKCIENSPKKCIENSCIDASFAMLPFEHTL